MVQDFTAFSLSRVSIDPFIYIPCYIDQFFYFLHHTFPSCTWPTQCFTLAGTTLYPRSLVPFFFFVLILFPFRQRVSLSISLDERKCSTTSPRTWERTNAPQLQHKTANHFIRGILLKCRSLRDKVKDEHLELYPNIRNNLSELSLYINEPPEEVLSKRLYALWDCSLYYVYNAYIRIPVIFVNGSAKRIINYYGKLKIIFSNLNIFYFLGHFSTEGWKLQHPSPLRFWTIHRSW